MPIMELADRVARWLPPPPVQKVRSSYSPYAARPYLKSPPIFLLSRRQELAAPGLHGVGGAAVAYDAYKFNFSTPVAVRVFWPEPIEHSILLLFTTVFI
jgi:hypothetical protein